MKLQELLKNIEPVQIIGDADVEVSGVNIDSLDTFPNLAVQCVCCCGASCGGAAKKCCCLCPLW